MWTASKANEKLKNIEHDFLKDQMKQILDSFAAMSETKLLQDKFEFKLLTLDQDNKRIVQEKREQDAKLYELTSGNNQLLQDMKDMKHMHSKQMRHKEASINVLKDKN